MEHIFSLLLLLCALAPSPLKGATVSLQSTPTLPESTTVHALSNTTMNTTVAQGSSAQPSQDTHNFTVITGTEANTVAFTGMQESGTDGPTTNQTLSQSMNSTTEQAGPPPKAITTELQTQAPNMQESNSTLETTENTNQTEVTPSQSSADVTHHDSRNPISTATTEQTTRAIIPQPGMSTTPQLSTSSASVRPEPTTASTVSRSTSTTVKIPRPTPTSMKSTTRKTVPPVKPKPTPEKNDDEASETHGIAAAVIISLILLMMFVGIIFIMVKKRKWQRRQQENSDWAGPSPFLDGSSQPHFSRSSTKDESKRISFVGFLPQSLSKRHSMLDDTDEGLAMDIVPATTFGQTTDTTIETKPQNGTAKAKEHKAQEIKNEQDHQNTSESLPVTTAVADHKTQPEDAAIKENDNSEGGLEQTPSLQPSTGSTVIPEPPQPLPIPSSDIPEPPPPPTASSDIPPPPPLPTTASTDIPSPPTTTSTDAISPPAPDMDLQSSNDTLPASEVQIPPAPPLPES